MSSQEGDPVFGIPRWVVLAVIPLFITGTATACGWLWNLQSQNARQDEVLAAYSVKLEFMFRDQKVTQDKLDHVTDVIEDLRAELRKAK